jgi:DNA-binding transcriptional ArsR family regulator
MGNFFMTFAHATRMRIFCALQNGSKTVTRIAEESEISVSNASQHLRLMRDRGAVVSERQGQTVFYQMADPRFFEAASLIREALDDRSKANEYNADPACAPEPVAAVPTDKELPTGNHIQTTTN